MILWQFWKWLTLTVGLFLLQEFADYFERQLQTTEDSEHDRDLDTDATDTNVDPFAEIIWIA